MRKLLIATIMLISAPVAFAQEEDVLAPPARAAPTATAAMSERASWCEDYVAWLVAITDAGRNAPDARPTHRVEVEMNSCTIDPQGYERETRTEAQRAVEIASG